MIIIVEGIDRVGKTTLCNRLSNEFNIPVHKYKGIVDYKNMKNIEETDKMLMAIQLLQETNSNIILDRFSFSDYVYGLIERDYATIPASKNLFLVDEALSKIDDVFLILVEPTDIERSSLEHGSDLSMHKKMFDDVFKESHVKNKWKCTYNTIGEVVSFIKSKNNIKK